VCRLKFEADTSGIRVKSINVRANLLSKIASRSSSTSLHVFMAWCLIKHWNKFTT
jgi:hypothetical protein